MLRKRITRLVAMTLCVVMLLSHISLDTQADLQTYPLQLEMAQSMALGSSKEIVKQNNSIILKRMKYVESVEGIRAKIKNLRTFRWSPLLNFKFPEQLNMSEEYDLNIKPLVLQTEIDTMVHELNDLKYEIIHETNQLFFDVYLLQETITFTQQRLEDAQQQLARNRAKLSTGDAMQADVDKAQSTVDSLTLELSNLMREFENAKIKLKDRLGGTDITVGYEFVNGFKEAEIPRSALESLTEYTLNHDQAYYEAKVATAVAKMNMESYESLMRKEYGSKMNYIQNYINMIKQGMEVDYSAFQLKYREMIKALDKPWDGKIRILFFKFTKEWFKGEIDGTRYIEDEIYAVYTACMEYANAVRDQKNLEKELRAQVRDSYENIVTSWKSYEALKEGSEKAKESLDRALALNKLGKATYTEVADEQEAYQQIQMDALNALKDYNDIVSEFDRLTCGAVTQYLKGTGMDMETGEGGDAYAILDPIYDPYYYIYTSVADMKFHIGVSIPADFSPEINRFEVWYAGTQIGERTDVGKELQHLALDYKDTSKLLIRLYNGDTFVDECEIDAAVPRDVLDIEKTVPAVKDREIGTYSVNTTLQGGVSVSELKVSIQATEGVAAYKLTYGNDEIYTTELHPVSEPFVYLTLLIGGLNGVTLNLYDNAGNHIGDAVFDTDTQTLVILASAQ